MWKPEYNTEHKKAAEKLRHYMSRKKVLDAYGNKCICCGETEIKFLSIDHIDGRKKLNPIEKKLKGANLYRWLIAHKFPKGFQILCYNCNCAKGFYGVCPHQEIKEEA